MDEVFELLKLILPAGIVFLTTYYLVKSFLTNEQNKKKVDLKLANQEVITPIRLQAYERIVLFLERINPTSLVMRVEKTGSSASFQGELLKSIRNEFEHNLSQQIYMSNKSWDAVLKAKEETIKIRGKVIDVLPNALFKIEVENGHVMIGHISGKVRKNNIKILVNDEVDVEVSAYDLSKCRITYRYK